MLIRRPTRDHGDADRCDDRSKHNGDSPASDDGLRRRGRVGRGFGMRVGCARVGHELLRLRLICAAWRHNGNTFVRVIGAMLGSLIAATVGAVLLWSSSR